MKKKQKNITRSIITKTKIANFELNNIILRSCKKNKLIDFSKHMSICYHQAVKGLDKEKSKQICLVTGRRSGILKKFNLSRHAVLKNNIFGNLQPLKIASW